MNKPPFFPTFFADNLTDVCLLCYNIRMKFQVILDILFELLSKRRVTANYLAEKHGLSPRTVYRYVEVLAVAVPVRIKRGRDGGICLPDSYKLPVNFLTEAELSAAIEALSAAYEKSAEERFLSAIRKLSAEEKNVAKTDFLVGETGNFFIDTKETKKQFEKLQILEEALREKTVVEIECKGASLRIEPHALVLKENAWFVYAFWYTQRTFRLFPLADVSSVSKTEESFRARPFQKTDVLS